MITRIDLTQTSNGLIVNKYREGWVFNTFPEHEFRQNGDMKDAITKLKTAGWTVDEWFNGARAWRTERKPVRPFYEVPGKRRALAGQLAKGYTCGYTQVDLLYDM